MNVSSVSSSYAQSLLQTRSEGPVEGVTPDHDGDRDDHNSASSSGSVHSTPVTTSVGHTINTHA